MASPIKLQSHKVHIEAPRELIYQKMSSFGSGKLKGDNNESSKVISKEGNKLVVEFVTKAGPFSYTTVEEINLYPPERITFQHLSGPLHHAWEEFIFNDVDGFATELIHNGEIIWKKFPFFGWLGGRIYTKPAFERVLEKHMAQIKESCEARAARSRVFPRRPVVDSEAPAKTD